MGIRELIPQRLINFYRRRSSQELTVEALVKPPKVQKAEPVVKLAQKETPGNLSEQMKIKTLDDLAGLVWAYYEFTVQTFVEKLTVFEQQLAQTVDGKKPAELEIQLEIFYAKVSERYGLLKKLNKHLFNQSALSQNGSLDLQPNTQKEVEELIQSIGEYDPNFISSWQNRTTPLSQSEIANQPIKQRALYYSFVFHELMNFFSYTSATADFYKLKSLGSSISENVLEGYRVKGVRALKDAQAFMTAVLEFGNHALISNQKITDVVEQLSQGVAHYQQTETLPFTIELNIENSLTQESVKEKDVFFSPLLIKIILNNIVQNTTKAYAKTETSVTRSKPKLNISLGVKKEFLYLTFDDFGHGFSVSPTSGLVGTYGQLAFTKGRLGIVRQFIFSGESSWQAESVEGNGVGMKSLVYLVESALKGRIVAGNRLGLGNERGGARVEFQLPLHSAS